MSPQSRHIFVLGKDYHLGDLLWFTAVLAEYRQQIKPDSLVVVCPDRAISRILENNPLIDELVYNNESPLLAMSRSQAQSGSNLVVHDLRVLPIAVTLIRQWGYRQPWLYYRDLWLEPRGQWLATFLRLGRLPSSRPVLRLTDKDRTAARDLAQTLKAPIIVLAPYIGQYTLPLFGTVWRCVKGWDLRQWHELAEALRRQGFVPVTMAAAGDSPIPGTVPAIGLPIRQAAGIIEQSAALISVESGLWYMAAAFVRPFVIVPWWLPRSLDWISGMNVPHSLIPRSEASVRSVLTKVQTLMDHAATYATDQ